MRNTPLIRVELDRNTFLHHHAFHCPNNMSWGDTVLSKWCDNRPSWVFIHDNQKILSLHAEKIGCNTFERTGWVTFHNKRLVGLGSLAFCTTLALLHHCTTVLRDVWPVYSLACSPKRANLSLVRNMKCFHHLLSHRKWNNHSLAEQNNVIDNCQIILDLPIRAKGQWQIFAASWKSGRNALLQLSISVILLTSISDLDNVSIFHNCLTWIIVRVDCSQRGHQTRISIGTIIVAVCTLHRVPWKTVNNLVLLAWSPNRRHAIWWKFFLQSDQTRRSDLIQRLWIDNCDKWTMIHDQLKRRSSEEHVSLFDGPDDS